MRYLLAATVAALALLAGCGGGDDEQSASEEWVSGLCSAAADWRSSIDDIIAQFQDPSSLSADSVREAVGDGLDATQTFADDVRDLGRPETEAGQQAESIVDSVASEVTSTAEDLQDTLGSGSQSLPDLIGKLSQAGAQLGQMGQDLRASLEDLQNLDGGDELRDEIEANADCDAARGGS